MLEAQKTLPGTTYLPIEVLQAEFDAIQLATSLGVVVIEAGGNGGNDLDTINVPGVGFVLNRSHADFRDSGAIMVGASSSAAPHTKMGFSNYGSRIDCYAWGQNVDTLTTDAAGTASQYTGTFGGTSSASPIITGAALIVQGLMEGNHGFRYSPYQMRDVLSDPANGTASSNPAVDRIGVMPNLQTIIDVVIGVSPDVYVRDYVGDDGDVAHAGAISASPDVILQPALVADPQAMYGEGSGTENSNMLGYVAEAGQDNFIYVRARNRGGSDATNVDATVFWSPAATLVTPDLWTLAGSVTIPNVPVGDTLVVSDAITWPSASIPATGHYCFVCLIGNGRDPAPAPADFNVWDNFTDFIRNYNNVTWRNFNVENNMPPPGAPPPGFIELPFLLTGAHDKARIFDIHIVSKLPKGAKFILEAPLYVAQKLFNNDHFWQHDKKRERVRIPLRSRGIEKLRGVELPARLRAKCKLLMLMPKDSLDRFYEVSIRQFYKELEVGRITWNVGPVKVKRPNVYDQAIRQAAVL